MRFATLLPALLPLGLPLTGLAQTPAATFAPAATFGTGANSQPLSIAVADVNGDGKLDLLTANVGSNTAGVLLGTGTGTFGAVTVYSTGTGSSPYAIAVADVNRDGKPDLLTANYNTNTAGVLLGTGTGSFSAAAQFNLGAGPPHAITVADVNGDGKPDLLAADFGVEVLLGTGTGSFGAATTFSPGPGIYPAAIAVADVNSDGKPDLVAVDPGDNVASVLLGTGTGSFGAATTFSTGAGSQPQAIAVADVNSDGKPDLLTANALSSTVGVLLGTGTGSFGAVAAFSVGNSTLPDAIAVADVNGDGRPDLLVANYTPSTAGVLLGTGTGTFGTVATFSTGVSSRPTSMVAADVNGDGRPDLLTANYYSNTVGVLLNAGTYTPLATPAALAAEAVALYPNPAHGRLQVALPAGAVQATLLDALGRVVRQQAAAGPAFTLEAEGLAAGVYTLRLQAGAATVARRVVLN